VLLPGRTLTFGDVRSELRAQLRVHRERFFSRALLGGDTAIGEAYMDADWSTPDLVSLMRLAVRNLAQLEKSNSFFSSLSRFADRLRRSWRSRTRSSHRSAASLTASAAVGEVELVLLIAQPLR